MWDATEPGPNGDPPGDLGQFMVFRSGPTNQALAVAYSISGTATNGVDYTELPGSITIPAGEESALISIEALYDDLAEFDETVTLTLELTGEYLIDPAYCEATVTIQSNAFVAVAELDGPVGIDYHGPLDSLIVSYNYATGGNPRNFARIDSNGQVTPWSLVSNLLEEVKVATAKQTASGWQQGQLYFGTGLEGQIRAGLGRRDRCDVELGESVPTDRRAPPWRPCFRSNRDLRRGPDRGDWWARRTGRGTPGLAGELGWSTDPDCVDSNRKRVSPGYSSIDR